ncbi:hypothetical protein JMJ35_001053 [Cladonia borealis]|uniref:CFEM domain-containing protein n=1 Tax=Cladonia borealis TaxID=184061 RepID=A0AA39V9T1_9LECA|nr:hypothetical protein JMJ35_001053 [Cladonia borealis]
MQHHFHILISFATIILQIKAQDLSGLPTCAQASAISSFTSTGCQITDLTCICDDSTFIESLAPAIEKDCSPADIQEVSTFAMQLCDSVSVTLSLAGIISTAQPTVIPATTSTSVGDAAFITNGATASNSSGGLASLTNVAAISSPVTPASSVRSPSTSSPTKPSAGNATTTFSGSGSAALDWRLVNIKLSLCVVSVMWLSGL